MFKKIAVVAGLSLLVVGLAACGNSALATRRLSAESNTQAGNATSVTTSPVSQTPVTQVKTFFKPSWITPEINGDIVLIPLSKIESEANVHFKVTVQDNNLTFMAYIVDGNPIVRASICPPCRSQSFTLKNKTLVCDRCATVFDARTGAGISGACVNYPKASVAYNLENGKLTIKIPDMNTAYQNTEKPGLP